ncbi:hypothetical protein SCP_0402840 [Sparassis crispa]|uniref:Uncharacterized protein n=1 Tax=Sparassis crispa TaxID=139825 RepID=A0A401GI88_9APHY|nr:hypothetical protein SCP_0402840 [Sparassis crispa]GBE81910.1 hypothetical protein SCP_0402840 [Sparassis crispa]
MSGAARVAKQGMAREHVRITEPSICLTTGMNALVDDVVRNGNVHGYPGCVNISFAYAEGESLMMALKDVALCSDSACTSASLELSYVLCVLVKIYAHPRCLFPELSHVPPTTWRIPHCSSVLAASQRWRRLISSSCRVGGPEAARREPAQGDGSGRHRHQHLQLGPILMLRTWPLGCM